MAIEVRSGYNVTLKVIDPNGNEKTTGHFHSKDKLLSYDLEETLPHLQRISPSGFFLATLSNKSTKLRLDSVDPAFNQWKSRTLRIKGVRGRVQEIRWLPDDAGIALRTWENIYIVPFDTRTPNSSVRAQTAFHPRKMENAPVFLTMRSTDHGLLIMTHEIPWSDVREIEEFSDRITEQRGMASYDRDPSLQGYFLPFIAGKKGKVIPLRPHGRSLQFVNTLSDNRITVVSNPLDVPPGEQLANASVKDPHFPEFEPNVPANLQHAGGTLQVFEVKEHNQIQLVSSFPCGQDGTCRLHNWSPNAKRVLYSDELGEIFLQLPEETPHAPTFTKLRFSEDGFSYIHALWLNEAEDRVVAASPSRIRVWDGAGKILWTWDHSEESGRIGSVQFAQDGETILASVQNKILRIRNGKSEVLVTGKHDAFSRKSISRRNKKRQKRRKRTGEQEEVFKKQFIDGILPLPDGSIAFAVVTTHFEEVYDTAD